MQRRAISFSPLNLPFRSHEHLFLDDVETCLLPQPHLSRTLLRFSFFFLLMLRRMSQPSPRPSLRFPPRVHVHLQRVSRARIEREGSGSGGGARRDTSAASPEVGDVYVSGASSVVLRDKGAKGVGQVSSQRHLGAGGERRGDKRRKTQSQELLRTACGVVLALQRAQGEVKAPRVLGAQRATEVNQRESTSFVSSRVCALPHVLS